MKIKLESEKIIKAVKKLEGIDLVLESHEDAREAIRLLMGRDEFFGGEDAAILKEFDVTSFREYKTSAVDYKMFFLLDFLFQEDTPPENKISLVKKIQAFFEKG
ncbi:MAG: hypothetical protein ABII06_06930 [Pseudomonadota bacterium]